MERLNESANLWEEERQPPLNLLNLDNSIMEESWKRNWQVNRLVLLVKEPTTIFVYWELNDLRKQLICEHFQRTWTELPLFLQVNDVTDLEFNGYNAHSSRRIPVHPLFDHLIISGVQAKRRYLVDFGTLTPQGGFFTIIRSNIEETPPAHSDHGVGTGLRFAAWPGPNSNLDGLREKQLIKGPEKQVAWLTQFDGYSLAQPDGGQKKW
ncbi:MAG: hypothetical protein A4E52_01182 [Pelotomaculum sp. PtaB.Bin013]|uniref:DUF4912 domain-containing protein n=1 Tax=Pelotomaculum isophthalicicum JI TaxID=947010 RepID=A0A9X4H429_9FIRM|nr:DUF4912 domain-containing protein [Pelotomaculum isophthalicicum]MDF9410020.1 DUF4912 domain-containing protein [Pelotomaculum isophthalicicum JI]OPX88720.1 MAG: hypothetical protein A4E52_01182 [Pelotomaculum sp. PtaB.Bin013]